METSKNRNDCYPTEELELAAIAISLNVRLRSSNMPLHKQERALRCARSFLDSAPNHRPNSSDLARNRELKIIVLQNVTRLCHTKSMVTVNGQFPGPRIIAREGDNLLVKVVNNVQNNISIHWHGIRQLQTGWADGTAYITQCPIQNGQSYVYNYTIVGQRGTLWWHAHISWLRSTVYGPIIILPKLGVPYPFVKPYKEVPILFGEWFNVDTEAVINQALQTGGGPNVSDAYTINGLPGPLYNCSPEDTFMLKVNPGKTYLLRIINADLNDELFFSIANHTLTVVEVDAVYVKPFNTETIIISPGQTTNVLLQTKSQSPNATFLMAARPYPANFNLVDPVERNTVGVPSGGWVAIRFLADNPGIWFMHCHMEVHTSWGMKMGWVVLDGKLPNQKLLPPPSDLPMC
ncbi:hypothetical protein JCGZ_20981 [Jatropha curcas]|uniref:laccase n=1 Tax=Jatropha curcas TaxID=180498 RepID=A0A067JSW2_JATCU|nr:hypothetical protein JCGZ_20981 [Jatropha curcas]